MPLNEEQVRETLKQVIDPELFVNIIDLGLVYTVTVAPSQGDTNTASTTGEGATPGHETPDTAPKEDVSIEMTMTSPACPAGPQLIGNAKQVVGRLPGVANVEVKIVMTPPWTPDLMSEDARDQLGIF